MIKCTSPTTSTLTIDVIKPGVPELLGPGQAAFSVIRDKFDYDSHMGLIDRIRQHRAAAPQAASQAAPVPDGSSIEPIPPLTASDTAWLVNYATATLTELGRRVAG